MFVASAIVVQLRISSFLNKAKKKNSGPGCVVFQLQICMHKIFKSRLIYGSKIYGSETFIPQNAALYFVKVYIELDSTSYSCTMAS